MKNLHIAYSPYHLLLATSRARKEENSHLLFIPLFDNYEKTVEVLSVDDVFEGKTIYSDFLAEDYDRPFRGLLLHKKNSKFYLAKNVIEKFKQDFQDFPYDVSTHLDMTPETQYILYRNSLNEGKNTHIEDGMAIYMDDESDAGLIRELLGKAFFGRWYESNPVHGEYKYTDWIKANYPELVNRDKEVEQLSESHLEDLEVENLDSDYSGDLVLAPVKDFLERKEILEEFRDLVEKLNPDYVKYHPREDEDYLGDLDLEVVEENELPVELMFKKNDFDKVIGSVSTALYTAKIISPDSRVVSIARLLSIEDEFPKIMEVYGKSKVEVPREIR